MFSSSSHATYLVEMLITGNRVLSLLSRERKQHGVIRLVWSY